MKNVVLGDKVYTYVDDHSNNRGMGPDRVKVYGYVTKVNTVTCDVTLVDKTILRRNIREVGLYTDPYCGLTYEQLVKENARIEKQLEQDKINHVMSFKRAYARLGDY
jgi:hypothetical protein